PHSAWQTRPAGGRGGMDCCARLARCRLGHRPSVYGRWWTECHLTQECPSHKRLGACAVPMSLEKLSQHLKKGGLRRSCFSSNEINPEPLHGSREPVGFGTWHARQHRCFRKCLER